MMTSWVDLDEVDQLLAALRRRRLSGQLLRLLPAGRHGQLARRPISSGEMT